MYDVKTDLERLPDSNVWDVARNLDAACRLTAIRILCERGSDYARRAEIAQDVERFALDVPADVAALNAPDETRAPLAVVEPSPWQRVASWVRPR